MSIYMLKKDIFYEALDSSINSELHELLPTLLSCYRLCRNSG